VSKVSSYPGNTNPDNSFEFLGTDPANLSQGSTGTTEVVTLATLKSVIGGGGGGSSVWKDLVGTYGADPSGGTSASAALASACTAAVAAQPAPFGLTVPPGAFLLTQSQDLPYNLVLQGAGSIGGDVTGQYGGTVFNVASSFSGTYVFGFRDNSNHTSANGCYASGFTIFGGNQTGSAVNGLYIVGPVLTTLRYITMTAMSGWGIATGTDSSAAEQFPYGQNYYRVQANSCGVVSGGGFQLNGCEDSVFAACYSIGNNNGPGFYIAACDNTKFIGCNSEWNSTHGYYFTGDWQYFTGDCQLIGCSTDANANYGVYIDATWTTGGGAGTGPGMILITGLGCRRDGKGTAPGSGIYAGIGFGATTLPVVISSFTQSTDIGDGGAGTMSPNFGIYFSQTSYSQPIVIGPGIAWGYTAALRTTSTSNAWPTGVVRSNVVGITGNAYSPTYGSVLT
jgi:hypothetical protein